MIYLYKTNGVITIGEDGKVPVTYYGRGGKSGKFYPKGSTGTITYIIIAKNTIQNAIDGVYFHVNYTTSGSGIADIVIHITNNVFDYFNLLPGSYGFRIEIGRAHV